MSETKLYNRRKPKRKIDIIINYLLQDANNSSQFASDVLSFFNKKNSDNEDDSGNNILLLKVEVEGTFREFISKFYDEFLKNKDNYKIRKLVVSKLSGYVFINEKGEKIFSVDA